MRTLATLLILAVAPGLAVAQATKEDLKKLLKAGMSEEVILAYIRANGYDGKPTSDDLVELKEAGLGDKILAGILEPPEETTPVPPTEPPAPAAAAPAAPVQTPVVVERPVSVYPSGTWSVTPTYTSSSTCAPTYRRYYTGSFHRPYYASYTRSYCRPSYYRSSYCGPRYTLSYSRRTCRW